MKQNNSSLIRQEKEIEFLMNKYLCSRRDVEALSDTAFILLSGGHINGKPSLTPSEKAYAKQLADRLHLGKKDANKIF